ncbi:phage holin family protein [Pseudonocardia xishanensis]|uniref:Phage holin family protein n=1 Tax=Pseudonocardia xishanensis TaxID=630995 RepID=A0ABP8RSS3_9PSEU
MTAPRPPAGAHPAETGRHAASGEPPTDQRSVGDLVGNVTRDLSILMRQELALAKAELKQEAGKTGKAAGAFGGAGFAAWFVVLFLSLALWAALSNLTDPGWAALIVAALWAVIAGILYATGRSSFRKVHPKPERTVDTLGQVPEALKGHRGDTP